MEGGSGGPAPRTDAWLLLPLDPSCVCAGTDGDRVSRRRRNVRHLPSAARLATRISSGNRRSVWVSGKTRHYTTPAAVIQVRQEHLDRLRIMATQLLVRFW